MIAFLDEDFANNAAFVMLQPSCDWFPSRHSPRDHGFVEFCDRSPDASDAECQTDDGIAGEAQLDANPKGAAFFVIWASSAGFWISPQSDRTHDGRRLEGSVLLVMVYHLAMRLERNARAGVDDDTWSQ